MPDGPGMFRHPLARDVAIIVAIKITIVVAAAFFVFGPKQRPLIDAQAVEMRLTDSASSGAPAPRLP
jgi:hypothetical protein